MRKEIKSYEIQCDICECKLQDSGTKKNDGSFQEPFLNIGTIDLCYNCAGKVLATQLAGKLGEEKMKYFTKETKKLVWNTPVSDLSVAIDTLGLSTENTNTPFKQETNISGVHSKNELVFETPNTTSLIPQSLNSIDDLQSLKDL